MKIWRQADVPNTFSERMQPTTSKVSITALDPTGIWLTKDKPFVSDKRLENVKFAGLQMLRLMLDTLAQEQPLK